jgi:hypothetical protein
VGSTAVTPKVSETTQLTKLSGVNFVRSAVSLGMAVAA